MAAGIRLSIIAMIFYFLKNMYQKVILKKSDDEILLEQLQQEYVNSLDKWNLVKSKEKVKKEQAEMLKTIADLKLKMIKQKIIREKIIIDNYEN